MRYAELRPAELAAALEERPLAIWPIGALEWHGPHLPLGLDGIVAEAFAQKLCDRAGGVLLPSYWHPITTLPHPMSLDVSVEAMRDVLRRTVGGLGRAGAQVVCIVTGHYAQGHSVELLDMALEFKSRPCVIAAAPLEPLEDDSLLDHAARWETAQLQGIRPDLVRLDLLPEVLTPKVNAVLGEDPRLGDPSEVSVLEDKALGLWCTWIAEALGGNTSPIVEFSLRRRERYAPYIARHYRKSWDQAIQEWWREQK